MDNEQDDVIIVSDSEEGDIIVAGNEPGDPIVEDSRAADSDSEDSDAPSDGSSNRSFRYYWGLPHTEDVCGDPLCQACKKFASIDLLIYSPLGVRTSSFITSAPC